MNAQQIIERLVVASVHGSIAIGAVWLVTRSIKGMSARWSIWLWRLAFLKGIWVLFGLPAIGLVGLVLPVNGVRQEWAVDLALVVMAAGALLIFGLTIVSIWFGNRSVRAGGEVSDGALHDGLVDLCDTIGVRQLPKLVAVPSAETIYVMGWFRPTIVVPSGMKWFNDKSWQVAFAHELSHLRNRDAFWGWLPMVCRALFWFNPLFWFAERAYRLEAEKCCDETAAIRTGFGHHGYAEALLSTASSLAVVEHPPGVGMSTLGPVSSLEVRVRHLLASAGKPLHRGASTASLLVTGLALIPFIGLQADSGLKIDEPGSKVVQPLTSIVPLAVGMACISSGRLDPDGIVLEPKPPINARMTVALAASTPVGKSSRMTIMAMSDEQVQVDVQIGVGSDVTQDDANTTFAIKGRSQRAIQLTITRRQTYWIVQIGHTVLTAKVEEGADTELVLTAAGGSLYIIGMV